jgi:hypothetical protein
MKGDFNFITRLSQSVNREIGLCLVETGEAAISFGDEKSAKIGCPKGEPKIIFHTHPLGTATPSAGDIGGLLHADISIEDAEYCVGAMKDGEPIVKCVSVEVIKERNRVVLSLSEK